MIWQIIPLSSLFILDNIMPSNPTWLNYKWSAKTNVHIPFPLLADVKPCSDR